MVGKVLAEIKKCEPLCLRRPCDIGSRGEDQEGGKHAVRELFESILFSLPSTAFFI